MERASFGNRPTTIAPRTKIEDFVSDAGHNVRVSIVLRQVEDTVNQAAQVSEPVQFVTLDVQAFEVDAAGVNKNGPDGRPSRTPGTTHTVIASSLGDTHTLAPGWVRIVGTYDDTTFDATVPRVSGKPTAPPEAGNVTGQAYDPVGGIGYVWHEGETLRIARAKVQEMDRIIANSNAIAGIEF